jgi:hypothetical protein
MNSPWLRALWVLVAALLIQACGRSPAAKIKTIELQERGSSIQANSTVGVHVDVDDASGRVLQYKWLSARKAEFRFASDNSPAAIYIAPREPGKDEITVQIFQDGKLLDSKSQSIEVVGLPGAVQGDLPASQPAGQASSEAKRTGPGAADAAAKALPAGVPTRVAEATTPTSEAIPAAKREPASTTTPVTTPTGTNSPSGPAAGQTQKSGRPDRGLFGFEDTTRGAMGWKSYDQPGGSAVRGFARSTTERRSGQASLQIDLKFDSIHRSGEAAVDFVYNPPNGPADETGEPLDLSDKPITAYIKFPEGLPINPDSPPGLQLFAKDADHRNTYGCWQNVEIVGRWIRLTLVTSKKSDCAGALRDEGFDPSHVRRIGVKIAGNEQTPLVYKGACYLDDVSW